MKKKYISLSIAIPLLVVAVLVIINCAINSYCPAKALNHIENINDQTDLNGIAALFTNNMNNILTWFGAMIAFLAIFVAIAGWITYETFRKDIENKLSKYDVLLKLKEEFESYQEKSEKRYKKLYDYTEEAIHSFYDILFLLAQKTEDKDLNTKIFRFMKKFNLYSNDKNQRVDALYFFRYNGTKKDIPLLEDIVKNDLDEDVKTLAVKTIGIIEVK